MRQQDAQVRLVGITVGVGVAGAVAGRTAPVAQQDLQVVAIYDPVVVQVARTLPRVHAPVAVQTHEAEAAAGR
jgi:hypothetical protein